MHNIKKINVFIFGITGSIGENFLKVHKNFSDQIEIIGFSYHSNSKKAQSLANNLKPLFVIYTNKLKIDFNILLSFQDQEKEIRNIFKIKKIDIIINGVSGVDGLRFSIFAIKQRITLALANKETFVAAGKYINSLLLKYNTKIIPIDSEHSALYYLIKNNKQKIYRYILTASGGSLLKYKKEELININDKIALKHPNWNMGQEITINSATMMNKAFEMIEAKYLFHIFIKDIEVVIHPQSLVHGGIITVRDEVILYASYPTMELPILYSLIPNICTNNKITVPFFNTKKTTMTFSLINENRFEAIKLVKYSQKFEYGEIVLLISNEFFVQKFIEGKIRFYKIILYIKKIISNFIPQFDYDPLNISHIYKIIIDIQLYCSKIYNIDHE